MSVKPDPRYQPAWHLSGPKPYAVQLEAMRRSQGKARFAQFLEQGLGKTPLTINEYIESFSDYDTVIMLCPNSFKKDWTLAPADWGIPEIKGSMWPDDEMKHGTSDNPRFNVINYEAVRGSGYGYVAELMNKRPCLLVIDESSAIKNYQSKTAKAVLDLSKRAAAVRELNGTPLVQNVMDLFPQLKCLGELQGMNPFIFKHRYAVLGGYMGKKVVGVRNEDELHKILERCSFRALKKDWSDLPEKIKIPLRLEMTDRQRKHYKEMLDDFYTIVKGEEYDAPMVTVQMDKLRQITSGVILDGDRATLIEEPKNNPKIKAVLDLIESGTGKMIIVHFYTKIGQMIFDVMQQKGLDPAYIRGQMKPEDVYLQKKRFNEDPNCRVLVGQITATSKAHTLLGGEGNDRAHRMFFHDHTFSLLDRSQMEDRCHRGAQDRAVLYYDPIMSPIDEAQLRALETKQDIATMVVDAVRALKM